MQAATRMAVAAATAGFGGFQASQDSNGAMIVDGTKAVYDAAYRKWRQAQEEKAATVTPESQSKPPAILTSVIDFSSAVKAIVGAAKSAPIPNARSAPQDTQRRRVEKRREERRTQTRPCSYR